jgi:ribosome biogenesis GTPase
VLDELGWNERWSVLFADVAPDGARPGRIVRDDGASALVAQTDGERARPLRVRVAVGDWVVVDGGMVVDVLHRRSLLRRADPAGGEQWLAANVDVVLVVCGLDRPVRTGRVERAVTLALDAGATPVVVLTKADLGAGETPPVPPFVDVVTTSSATGAGIEQVRDLVRERTVVLLGESGAGKSTLLNALLGDTVAPTGPVRAGDAKGRHTTTARHLRTVPGGGVVIDTPGIRAIGLAADTDAVDAGFPDVTQLAGGCHFADCAHGEEPGCAVVAAVDAGDLPAARLASWRSLRREALAMERRADPVQRRRDGKRSGRMAREAQAAKGPRPR